MSLLFVLFFLFVIVKQYFLTPLTPPYQELPFGAHNFVPFMTTASYIEFSLYNNVSLIPLIHYIVEMIFLGIPIGFFVRIYGNRFPFLLRLLTYFAIPIVLECLQELTGQGWGDIDDVAMSLLGMLIGVIVYHIMNLISQSVSNREFMMERNQSSNYFS
jgi:glycopeptide antibiotics resistance protein